MSKFKDLSLEDEEYVLNLPYHLAKAGRANDIYNILTELEFLKYKILISETQSLIEDYDLSLHADINIPENIKKNLKLIQGAIRLSANLLIGNIGEFESQLVGRLMHYISFN